MIKIYFIIPFLFIFLYFYYIWNKNNYYYIGHKRVYEKNKIAILLIIPYLISASTIFAVDYIKWFPFYDTNSYTTERFILYSILIIAILLPAQHITPIESKFIIKKYKHANIVLLLMSILGLYAIIYQIPFAYEALSHNTQDLRSEMYFSKTFILPENIYTTIAIGISTFYTIFIFMFYYTLIFNKHIIYKILMLIGSTSIIISSLTFKTRDIFIFYPTMFIFSFFYFKPCLTKNEIKIIKYITILFISVFFISISSFTHSRFSNLKRDELLWGTIGYSSSQPFTFCQTLEKHTNFYYGDLRFPFFKSLLTLEEVPEVIRVDHYESMFGTLLKDIYAEGGYTFLLIFVTVFSLYFYKKFQNLSKNKYISTYLIYTLYVQFISGGLFYLTLGSRSGNIYTITIFILHYFLLKKNY